MNMFEHAHRQMDITNGAVDRIVFQLNLPDNKLRYSRWAGQTEEDRTEGLITDFQEALHNCSLVHPEDVHLCDQIIHKQMDTLAMSTAVIRLRKGSGHYPRYRLYTTATNDTQGAAVYINGILEVLPCAKAIARQSKVQAQQDTLFRYAFTSNACLSMGFHYLTGNRLVSALDVLPAWLPNDASLRNVVSALSMQALAPEDQHKLESMLNQSPERTGAAFTQSFYRDCRLRDLSRQTTEFRWYRVCHAYAGNTPKQPACLFLTIIDINEAKAREQQNAEQALFDPITGMLSRSAFESQFATWLQRMKREAVFTYLCAVVILMDNPIEINARHGHPYLAEKMVQLAKMVKAFIHPHEMCCRYGLGEFAMVLAGCNKETLDERLKMLRFACNAQKSEQDGLRILFASNIETAGKADHGDIFLEKAYQAALSSRHGGMQVMECVAPAYHAPQYQIGKEAASQGVICREDAAHHIFIRTFGHFDVFVNGEAVLFNHPKAKELFALLVDRRGGYVSATEAISCLWEDEPANQTTLARCRKAAQHMRQTLACYGVGAIIETVNGKRRILVDQCDIDFFHYLQQGADAPRKLIGSYMNEYSWAECSVAYE